MLAHSLENLGHSVAVIDQDETAFRRLGPDFKGLTIRGVGFDREHLIEAGIERAENYIREQLGANNSIIRYSVKPYRQVDDAQSDRFTGQQSMNAFIPNE